MTDNHPDTVDRSRFEPFADGGSVPDDGPLTDGGSERGRVREAHLSGADLTAYVCPNGHATFPGHQRCPECGEPQDATLDLSSTPATVVTWTTSNATPPGVREPNHLAIVEFDLQAAVDASDDHDPGSIEGPIRTLAQLTTGDVESGDTVEPVYVDELRDPDAGIRHPDSQSWDGYRFEPVED
jgi:uncharacterized OB-fold protein